MIRALPLAVCVAAANLWAQEPAGSHWQGTWGCAPQLTEPANMPPAPGLSGNTLRQVVRVTVGGKRLRVRFSNAYGKDPVRLNSVHLATPAGGGTIRPESVRALAFHGESSATISAGNEIMSDPLNYDLPAMSDVAITIAFGETSASLTGHPGSRATSYIQAGNAIDAADLPEAAKTAHWYILTGIDVMVDVPAAAAVILGDSITDGRGSTTDGNDRWTDDFAGRLHANPSTASISVLNEALGGNTILGGGNGPPAVVRFDHDLFGQSSAKWLIVLEGVNDIGVSASSTVAADLIAAFGQFIDKAHAQHIRVYGVPILPFGRSMYSSPAHEAARQTVNNWIRASGRFDAVIDMDQAVRDPAEPANLLAEYDTGDHLHLNPVGYRKMADAIDLKLFAQ